MVAALTLDLKNSQKYDLMRRNDLQRYLIDITDKLNLVFHGSLLRELRFNGGDEIQGLFQEPGNAFLCLRLFHRCLHKIPFHAGIGIGEWSTVIDNKDTFYQDGSAYHRARKAIELSKKEKEYTAVISSGTGRDPVLNAMLNSCFQLMAKSTESQNTLLLLFECCYPLQSSVQINLNALEKLLPVVFHDYRVSRTPVLSETAEAYIQDSDTSNDSLVFQDAHPFGAAKRLADIMGSTRQNIDKALYATNVYAERAAALALLFELRAFVSDNNT